MTETVFGGVTHVCFELGHGASVYVDTEDHAFPAVLLRLALLAAIGPRPIELTELEQWCLRAPKPSAPWVRVAIVRQVIRGDVAGEVISLPNLLARARRCAALIEGVEEIKDGDGAA